MRRTIKLLALLVLVLFAAAACQTKTTGGGGGKTAESMVIGSTDKPISFDPAWAYDFPSSAVLYNTTDTLVQLPPGKDKVTARLAEKWEVSDDGLTYTFHLVKGAKFHDGSPVNAAAVKFTFDRIQRLNVEEGAGFLLYAKDSGIESVEAKDESTVVIKLKARDVTFLSKLNYTVASIVSPAGYTDAQSATNVVGSGPYKLTDYKEGQSLRLEAFDGYWGTKPKTKKIEIKFFDKSSAMKLALENGEIDVAYRSFSPTEIQNLKKNNQLEVVEGKGAQIRYLVINVGNFAKGVGSGTTDAQMHVRHALACSVDRRAISDRVFLGTAKPLYSMIAQGFSSYKENFKTDWPDGDTACVNKHLGFAGVPAGQKVKIDLWFTPTHYGDTEDEVAQVLKSSIESTGRFEVNLQSTEWAQYKEQWKNQQMPVFLLGWYPDYLDADDYISPFYSTGGAASLGSHYSSTQMDDLVKKEQQTESESDRNKTFADIQALASQEIAGYIPLWQNNITSIVVGQKGVTGLDSIVDITLIPRFWLVGKPA